MAKEYKFIFKVLLYDECSSTNYYKEAGVGFARDYAEAAREIEEYYKKSLMEIQELVLSSNEGCIAQIPYDVYNVYKNEDEFKYALECDENGTIVEKSDSFEPTSKNF